MLDGQFWAVFFGSIKIYDDVSNFCYILAAFFRFSNPAEQNPLNITGVGRFEGLRRDLGSRSVDST
jgi:hypothetical protein